MTQLIDLCVGFWVFETLEDCLHQNMENMFLIHLEQFNQEGQISKTLKMTCYKKVTVREVAKLNQSTIYSTRQVDEYCPL